MEYIYENHEFNADHIAGLSLADFTEQNKANFFLNQPEGVRIDKLKEVWEGCKKAKGMTVGEPTKPTKATNPAPAAKVTPDSPPDGSVSMDELKA